MPLSSGTHFGPYEIADEIGAGGMGVVYRATDDRTWFVSLEDLWPILCDEVKRS